MSNGYVVERLPSHPLARNTGVILQHRRIWFDKHGTIPAGHVIHHKNGDRKDNRISNLECLSRADHSRHHFPHGFDKGQGKPAVYIKVKCSICKIIFDRAKWIHKSNKKVCQSKGHKYEPTCSRKCGAKLARIYLHRMYFYRSLSNEEGV